MEHPHHYSFHAKVSHFLHSTLAWHKMCLSLSKSFSAVFFRLGLSLLIFSLPLLGLGSKSISLSPGFYCVGQGNTIRFVGRLIFLQDFWQETRDADSRACTRSQVWVESNIILYTSTSITLPHLCQGYHGHWIATSSDVGMGRLGGGSFILGFGWGCREWVSYFFYSLLFLCCF